MHVQIKVIRYTIRHPIERHCVIVFIKYVKSFDVHWDWEDVQIGKRNGGHDLPTKFSCRTMRMRSLLSVNALLAVETITFVAVCMVYILFLKLYP